MRVSMLCPGIRVQIKVGSQMLDNSLKRFTGFVLRAMADGYSVEDIDAVVGLGLGVVDDEVAYLRRIGFLGAEDALSRNGQDFYNLLVAVEAANEKGLDAFVEGYGGSVVPYVPSRLTTDEPGNLHVLENRLRVNFLYGKDYGNATAFAMGQHEELFASLNKEQLASIYTQLEFERGPQEYMGLYLEELPPLDRLCGDDMEWLGLRRSFLQITYIVADRRLEEYRDILENLVELWKRDGKLVSKIGWQLIDIYKQEWAVNSQARPILFDNCTRHWVEHLPQDFGEDRFHVLVDRVFNPGSEKWIKSEEGQFIQIIEKSVERFVPDASYQVSIEWEEIFYTQRVPYDLFWQDILEKPSEVED